MRPTRQLWGIGLLTLSTAALAVVFSHPLMLGATALLGTWILAHQYRFYRDLDRMRRTLSVEQTPDRTGLRTGETTTVTVRTTLEPSPLSLTVVPGLPTATVAQSESRSTTLEVDPGSTGGSTTIPLECPVAGRHQFDQATVLATDGWFREELDIGPTPTLTVDARAPREVHVGSGGDPVSVVQGQHTTSHSGSGLTPAELREYVPGDNIDRIDWKATARLATVHIREYEPETDQPTTIVVDHRAALDAGPDGETKLDYVRDVALSMVVSARRLGDPVGLLAVGNDGITERMDHATEPAQYRRIRQYLFDLEPTLGSRSGNGTRNSTSGPSRQPAHTPGVGQNDIAPTTARVALRELESGGHSAFSRTLGPFYRHRQTYRTDIESEPLRGAIRTVVRRRNRRALMVLCTDDSDRVALTEAVHVARTGGSRVLVLITPSVLFDAESPAALEESFDRYVAFEEFRRKLDRLEGVTALEVGPREQLATVLATDHSRSSVSPSRGVSDG
ncbi:DUF58 domain-containing protein [Natrialba swarupiae]|uniref:DUF58 domain-containing protein n=1 Tax=Natrialba swarupiae TaxID=2448032 RepID=A0A5D5AHT5_9EURY|nr:DUF58 domain-containing protein [Natrialba swarupiae]TYT60493.1 DUF58 domain-containing protein [Natrialba swarupiae]